MTYSEGAGITAYYGPTIIGNNNIIYGNTAANYPQCFTYGTGSSISFNYTCSSQILSGTGNTTNNPQFVDPNNLNFYLQPTSPCIDTGNPYSPPDPDGTRIDMGAICFMQHGTIALSSNSLLFPQTAIGTEDTLAIKIYNLGEANLLIQNITNNLPNIFNVAWNPADSLISGGDSLTIEVIFCPVTQILYTDNLTIENNDTHVSISLEGTGMVSGLVDDLNRRIPTDFALFQAYPNPFNPTTTIGYQLPHSAHIKLTVYNTLGQVVKTLINSYVETGYHEVIWNGRHSAGKEMPSGIYMFRLESGSFQQVNKMMLMK